MKSASPVVFVSLAFLCTSLCNAASIWDDPCTVQYGISSEEGAEVEVPNTCTNGSIWWNYPRGTLSVTFTHTQPFTVCLSPGMGPRLEGIHQAVNGQSVDMDSPQEQGEETCTPTAATTVQVLLDQPSFMTYMTLYNFEIKFQE